MDHEDDGVHEPTRFAWVYDGLLAVGTLADWAKAWEADYYAGDCPPQTSVLTWDGGESGPPQVHKVRVTRGEMTENEMIPHLITVPGLHDVVSVLIDGRA